MLLSKRGVLKVYGEDKKLIPIEGEPAKTPGHRNNFIDGRSLRFDPATEKIIGDEEANRLVSRTYRKDHWAIPKGSLS